MYQSIFSLSNNEFNDIIMSINDKINRTDHTKAAELIDGLRLKSIFVNKSLEDSHKLLILKSNVAIAPEQFYFYNQTKEFNNVIISSYLNTKYQQPYLAESYLIQAINRSNGSDSLIRVFEILKSHNFNRRKKYQTNSLVKVRNRWNEKEALQLLDMLKINEKLLL